MLIKGLEHFASAWKHLAAGKMRKTAFDPIAGSRPYAARNDMG
ncbi:hypothetical protein Q4610_02915 [Sphingobium sp. HBC34]|uniref:Uncharacterized protein n=1 Tax=Sphingobium cyanobacteriorum TaxID=3063954 RepID=A0ABT8ZHT1_9SPHN|nr:hypothetical protein [Sphingobium sp. HBC34]MDO7833986.1 hypothetical protein [Sphingobium sp. HBC34]